MRRESSVVLEQDSDGAHGYYIATVPALHGCHTQARSLDQLMERTREAIELCPGVADDDALRHDFVGVTTAGFGSPDRALRQPHLRTQGTQHRHSRAGTVPVGGGLSVGQAVAVTVPGGGVRVGGGRPVARPTETVGPRSMGVKDSDT